MKVRVHVLGPRSVSVHCAPSLWERLLFGARELDDAAVAVSAPAGGLLWTWDSTSRRIRSQRVVDAIERALTRAVGEQLSAAREARPRPT